jgi:phage tail-like protein
MQRDEIALLLPEVFQRTLNQKSQDERMDVLSALLGVMEQLQERDEFILDNLDRYFDPYRVPEESAGAFLPFLARWVDLDWVLPERGTYEAGLEQLRCLILAAARLAQVRGTRQGLVDFLEAATGLPGFMVLESTERNFLITIHCPAGAEDMRPLVERIARAEKPAYAKCELIFVEQAAPALK